MVFVPFLQRLAAQQIENAVVPTKEFEVGSRFGARASNMAAFPARELRVERKLLRFAHPAEANSGLEAPSIAQKARL